MTKGFGACLIRQPELVADMVSQAKERSRLPVSIKIRIHNELRCCFSGLSSVLLPFS